MLDRLIHSEEEEEALYDDDVDDTEKSIPTRTRRSRKSGLLSRFITP